MKSRCSFAILAMLTLLLAACAQPPPILTPPPTRTPTQESKSLVFPVLYEKLTEIVASKDHPNYSRARLMLKDYDHWSLDTKTEREYEVYVKYTDSFGTFVNCWLVDPDRKLVRPCPKK